MFIIGGLAATLIRLNLLTPSGSLVTADTYNKLFSAHGIIMVFFFLVPVVPSVLGNFCLPLMIGARDLAFPRLNFASWYIYMTGARADPVGDFQRRDRHRLDVLHAVQQQSVAHRCRASTGGYRHRRLLVDFHRPEFHRLVHRLRAPG